MTYSIYSAYDICVGPGLFSDKTKFSWRDKVYFVLTFLELLICKDCKEMQLWYAEVLLSQRNIINICVALTFWTFLIQRQNSKPKCYWIDRLEIL
jgi:hypothetical protein